MTSTKDGAAFSEPVALLRHHETEERRPADVEADMKRLLLMARDAVLRDQLVEAQGVRRVTLLAKAATHQPTQCYCTGSAPIAERLYSC